VVPYRGGNGDPARIRKLLEARRNIDALAQTIVSVDDDVAEVDADPNSDSPVLGDIGLPLGHLVLQYNGAFHRIDDARILGQEAVAHQLEDAAAMRRDLRREQLLAVGLKAREDFGLVPLHKARVAHHIGSENGSKPSFHERPRESVLLGPPNYSVAARLNSGVESEMRNSSSVMSEGISAKRGVVR
jgi:hypothetical protein